MGLERLRSHFPRETWMRVHSALRAADYGGALRASFQQFRPTAGRHTANELTSVCHKSLSFPLGYSPTRSTEAPDQILATTRVATRETYSARTGQSHTGGSGFTPLLPTRRVFAVEVSAGEQSMAAAVRRPMTAQARGPGIAPLDTACASSSTAAGPGLEVARAGSTCRCAEATRP